MNSIEVKEGGVEPCIAPPKDLWSNLTQTETMTKSLLSRGYAIVKIKNEEVPIVEGLQKAQRQFFFYAFRRKTQIQRRLSCSI